MDYRTLVAVLQNREDAGRVLDCAVALATRFESHLVGIHAEAVPIIYTTPMEFPVTDLVEASSERSQQRARDVRTVFETRLAGLDISSQWRGPDPSPGHTVLAAASVARCADLVIAQQAGPDTDAAGTGNPNALIFESGRPVLFVPDSAPQAARTDRVLVCWNGKREAARAAFDALPFIRSAAATEILTLQPSGNGDGAGETSARQLADALARHGANVSVRVQEAHGAGKASAIEKRVADIGADLVVMGAYSHSRLKELLFGSVTRSILRSMPTLTLMSR